MTHRIRPWLLLCSCLAAAMPALAGKVQINYVDAQRFTDAGNTRWDEDHNLKQLRAYLTRLAADTLPADQTLKVDVLDVDLAGRAQPSRHGATIRIARGSADWPRIQLRYTLERNGEVLRQGEETISDMDYMNHPWDFRDHDPLRYEKRMLAQWMRTRFAG